MCGIAGLINLNGEAVSPDILKRMIDAMEKVSGLKII